MCWLCHLLKDRFLMWGKLWKLEHQGFLGHIDIHLTQSFTWLFLISCKIQANTDSFIWIDMLQDAASRESSICSKNITYFIKLLNPHLFYVFGFSISSQILSRVCVFLCIRWSIWIWAAIRECWLVATIEMTLT